MNQICQHGLRFLFLITFLPHATATDFESSDEIAMAGGKMIVAWPKASPTSRIEGLVDCELMIHFHGNADVVLREASRAKLDCAIAILNFNGLSTAYRRPFEKDPSLFDQILARANLELRKANRRISLSKSPLLLSSFSAGYGAVREILRSPKNANRIEGYVAADSIYASIVQSSSDEQTEKLPRSVLPEHMKDFLSLARLAAKGEKFFALTHSDQPTPYASTTETANYLIDALSLTRESLPPTEKERISEPKSWLPTSKCDRKGFQVFGYSGSTAEDHLQHLRNIGDAFLRIPELRDRQTSIIPNLHSDDAPKPE